MAVLTIRDGPTRPFVRIDESRDVVHHGQEVAAYDVALSDPRALEGIGAKRLVYSEHRTCFASSVWCGDGWRVVPVSNSTWNFRSWRPSYYQHAAAMYIFRGHSMYDRLRGPNGSADMFSSHHSHAVEAMYATSRPARPHAFTAAERRVVKQLSDNNPVSFL